MKRLRFQNQYGANSQLFKIFTRFMSFVLIICLSVVLLVYSYGVRTISKSLIQSNRSTAEHTAASTESIFREIELVLGNLGGNNYVQTYVIAQNPRILINELDSRLHELLSIWTDQKVTLPVDNAAFLELLRDKINHSSRTAKVREGSGQTQCI